MLGMGTQGIIPDSQHTPYKSIELSVKRITWIPIKKTVPTAQFTLFMNTP